MSDGLQVVDERGDGDDAGGAGHESSEHDDGPGDGLVRGDGELTLVTGPGSVILIRVRGEQDTSLTLLTLETAEVRSQLCGVTTTTTFTVKIPDSGEVSSPGHGA